jgi:serine/threonine protein kinase
MGERTDRKIRRAQRILKKIGLDGIIIQEFLGKGGFGSVYKVTLENDPTGIFYALKIIQIPLEDDRLPQEKKFLEKYLSVVKSLCSHCLVHVYPSFLREFEDDEEDKYYLTILADFVPYTLRHEKVFSLPEKKKVELILRLGECLEVLLKQGLVYTDLKPQNVGVEEGFIQPKILDLGGFKSVERLLHLRSTLSGTSSANFLYSPGWAPDEINLLIGKSPAEIKEFFKQETKDGKSTVYTLALMLAELLVNQPQEEWEEERTVEVKKRLKDHPLKDEIVKCLNRERNQRPTLSEFLERLREYLYGKEKVVVEEPKPETKIKVNQPKDTVLSKQQRDTIENLVIKKGQRLELTGKTYVVKKDIKIEPGGELIIKNATFLFEKDAGIIGKDCTFIAENSNFEALNEEWKNITLGGKIKGHIKGCTFKGGQGRFGEEIKNLLGLALNKYRTYGGALFISSYEGIYLFSNCLFKDCKADLGGGVYARENVQIKGCQFEYCSASWSGGGVYAWDSKIENCFFENCSSQDKGGGVYASGSTIKECKFEKCSAKWGGGVRAWSSTIKECKFENCSASNGGGVRANSSTVENCQFNNCSARDGGGVSASGSTIKECKFEKCSAKWGGGVRAWSSTIKECKFENCSASNGGGVYCYGSSNTLIGNTFYNCRPNNCGGKCSC